jgi:hypothetical protein
MKIESLSPANGWTEDRDVITNGRAWHKTYKVSVPDCECNGKVPLVVVTEHEWTYNPGNFSYNMELRAECPRSDWIEFQFYNLTREQIEESVDLYATALFRAWEAAYFSVKEANT